MSAERLPRLALAVDNERADADAHAAAMRIAEAVVFASVDPVGTATLAARLPAGTDVASVMADLERLYAARGVILTRAAGGWAFRTAPDLAYAMAPSAEEPRRLSRAAMEVLAIVAYHQPTTRAEIEEIRGVTTSKGTLDALLETRWIRLRGRRRAPGRPVTYGTTPAFLSHFGLDAVTDLPGLEELQGLGLLEPGAATELVVPTPSDESLLAEDEDPLEDADLLSLGPAGVEE